MYLCDIHVYICAYKYFQTICNYIAFVPKLKYIYIYMQYFEVTHETLPEKKSDHVDSISKK